MTSLKASYGRPWRVGAALGQHDEAGIIIETIDGLAVLITPDVDAVARATLTVFDRHSPQVWQAYHNLAALIVQDHNNALEREAAICTYCNSPIEYIEVCKCGSN